ncbi:hypothetical protein IAU59_000243 [Kwoniella sp. CBS 9459]
MDSLFTLTMAGCPPASESCAPIQTFRQASALTDPQPHLHRTSSSASLSSSTVSSAPSSQSPSVIPINLVLSNTYLRAEIFRYIDHTSLVKVLPASKLFFMGAVEVLYRDFKHQHYNRLVKRCHDQGRLEIYLGAVRTVDLSEETRTIQISKWETLISPFPNAKQIKRYTDILHRETPLDGSDQRYTFEYIYTERLYKEPRRLPAGRSGIPDHWKQRRRVNLNVYEDQFTFSDESDRGECLKMTIIKRMKQLDGPIDSLLINFRVSNHHVLEALKAVNEMGYGTPSRLLLRSADEALFDILELTAKTLTTIYIPIRQYDATELGIDDFLLKTPWSKLSQVRHFDIPVRRCKPSSIHRLEMDPSQSFGPPNYVAPGLEEGSPLSSNVHLHFIYPPDPDLAEKQAILDIKAIDHLARSLRPIMGGGTREGSLSCLDPDQGPAPISATFPHFPDSERGTHLTDELSSRLSEALSRL